MFVRSGSVVIALALAAAAHADVVIGGFDFARGGSFSVSQGADLDQFRDAITSAFPGTTFTGALNITPRYLATIDILFLSSATGGTSGIIPLSKTEQAAVSAFVMNGGRAILATDNNTFAGSPFSDEANESLIDFLQLDVTGTGAAWAQVVEVPKPFFSPVTCGPYGEISSYNIGWTGWYDSVIPAGATTLGTVQQNGEEGLLVFPASVLGPSSGAVVTFSDSTMFADGYINTGTNNIALVKNTIAYLIAPATCDGDLNGDGAVDAADLAIQLGAWNTRDDAADLDDDGIVGASDLGILLGAWGPC